MAESGSSNSSVGDIITSDNETIGSSNARPLDARSFKQDEGSGLDFSVLSPANGTRIKKTIRMLNLRNERARRQFALHVHEIDVLNILDECKANIELIEDPRHRDFKSGRLFANLPTENKSIHDLGTGTIVIDQHRFNGISLYDFLKRTLCDITVSFLLLMIYVEIHKLSVLGITHNDMHSGNIFVVETSSIDRLWNSNWEDFTAPIVDQIIKQFNAHKQHLVDDINGVPNVSYTSNKFIAWLDKLLIKLPFRVKVFDFDRATIHGYGRNTPNYARTRELLYRQFNSYRLSIQRLITSNDLHQSTLDMQYKAIRSNHIQFHGSLMYIYEQMNYTHKSSYDHSYGHQKFQIKPHDGELSPMKCIYQEIKTLGASWTQSTGLGNAPWPFDRVYPTPTSVPHAIPGEADLRRSEHMSQAIRQNPNTANRASPNARAEEQLQVVIPETPAAGKRRIATPHRVAETPVSRRGRVATPQQRIPETPGRSGRNRSVQSQIVPPLPPSRSGRKRLDRPTVVVPPRSKSVRIAMQQKRRKQEDGK